MSRRFYSKEFKYEDKNEDYTVRELCSNYQIDLITLYAWIKKYGLEGSLGLKKSKTWKTYSKELKIAAVRDYLSGAYSQV